MSEPKTKAKEAEEKREVEILIEIINLISELPAEERHRFVLSVIAFFGLDLH